jgi:hypothetical protein
MAGHPNRKFFSLLDLNGGTVDDAAKLSSKPVSARD